MKMNAFRILRTRRQDSETLELFEHHNKNVRELASGSIVIFAAAAIAKASTAFISALNAFGGGEAANIAYNFTYALIFAQGAGFYMALSVSKQWVQFHYWFELAIEHAGFAWKCIASIVIFQYLYDDQNVGYSALAWICLVGIVMVIIATSIYLQHHLFHPSHESEKHLEEYIANEFALPIAWTMNVIIASLFYGYVDDEYTGNPNQDEQQQGNKDEIFAAGFIFYAIGITLLIILIQYWVETSHSEDATENTHDSGHIVYESVADEGSVCSSARSGDLHPAKSRHSSSDSWSGQATSTVKNSLKELAETTAGYIVGCAWQTWNAYTFKRIFSFMDSGVLLALFLYASITTILLIGYMSRVSVMKARLQRESTLSINESEHSGASRSKSNNPQMIFFGRHQDDRSISQQSKVLALKQHELTLNASKLIVGWSWEEFVSQCVHKITPKGGSQMKRLWIFFAGKLIVAVLVIYVGAYLDRRMNPHSHSHSHSHDEHGGGNHHDTHSDGINTNSYMSKVDNFHDSCSNGGGSKNRTALLSLDPDDASESRTRTDTSDVLSRREEFLQSYRFVDDDEGNGGRGIEKDTLKTPLL